MQKWRLIECQGCNDMRFQGPVAFQVASTDQLRLDWSKQQHQSVRLEILRRQTFQLRSQCQSCQWSISKSLSAAQNQPEDGPSCMDKSQGILERHEHVAFCFLVCYSTFKTQYIAVLQCVGTWKFMTSTRNKQLIRVLFVLHVFFYVLFLVIHVCVCVHVFLQM